MKTENLNAYELIKKEFITDLDSMSYLLRHKKSGARVAVLENSDPNKVFYIGFRTPPKDSTGVAHIIEHTVLCGSDKYPAKDPFIELAKGSLNTFLNAMTYPDKTVYPVASCNDKDFKNLMDVYLDAVFHPNIYKEEKIFKQEGWHYELDNAESDLKINGVVYNEMKGAFSSPDDVLNREIMNSLYPDTTYGVESGGDPVNIPDLTYEGFLDFHRRYYHPSNSYIYLYGNADMEERLDYIDKEYLSDYDVLAVESFPGEQTAFDEIRHLDTTYPITDDEDETDNTYLSMNFVVDKSLNRELYIAFQIVDYALISSQGTPLKKALIDKNIGKEVYSYFENGIYQPYYSIVAKNANIEDKDEFVKTIYDVSQQVVKNGFDKDALLAALNNMEFKYRESDYGSKPRGLMLGLVTLDSWLYSDEMPFINIVCNETFKTLREKINSDYYEKLVEKYILSNKHGSVVTAAAQKGLTAKKDKELADKLAEYKKSLSKAEIDEIVSGTKALTEYQETPDSEEVLKKIPMLTREDLEKKIVPLSNSFAEICDTKVVHHDIFTNGISYINFEFLLKDISSDLLPYVKLITSFFGCFDTNDYSYEKLGYEIDKNTGNMSANLHTVTPFSDLKNYYFRVELNIKVFSNQIGKALELAKEVIVSSKLRDYKRLKELIDEQKSEMESIISYMGHVFASGRALSHLSGFAACVEKFNGIEYLRFLENIDDNFDTIKEDLVDKMIMLTEYIFRPDNLLIDFTGTKEDMKILEKEFEVFKKCLYVNDIKFEKSEPGLKNVKEGFTSSSQVNFVCYAGNFSEKGLEYTGALKVLKTIMGYEYLWNEVRVKGGAYGCMSAFGRNGDCYFVSYRDPNVKKTMNTFKNAANFVRNFEADEKRMTKFIIGTLSDMDIPLTPRTAGERSKIAYLSELTEEILQKERDEVLNCSEKDVKNLANYIDVFIGDESLVVIGNEEAVKKEEDSFDIVKSLFN